MFLQFGAAHQFFPGFRLLAMLLETATRRNCLLFKTCKWTWGSLCAGGHVCVDDWFNYKQTHPLLTLPGSYHYRQHHLIAASLPIPCTRSSAGTGLASWLQEAGLLHLPPIPSSLVAPQDGSHSSLVLPLSSMCNSNDKTDIQVNTKQNKPLWRGTGPLDHQTPEQDPRS